MNQKEYQHQYYLDHRKKKLDAAKKRHNEKRIEILAYQEIWRLNHPKSGTIAKTVWRKKNPEKQTALASKIRKTQRLDPKFRILESISQSMRHYLKGKNGKTWTDLVGYTPEQLRSHIEKRFKEGMTWDNYGKWHLDHIIPVTAFNFQTPNDIDFKKCWSLKNLRPLWARENISKGNKLESPFQPSLTLEHIYSALRKV
jgi:hypothetical protein